MKKIFCNLIKDRLFIIYDYEVAVKSGLSLTSTLEVFNFATSKKLYKKEVHFSPNTFYQIFDLKFFLDGKGAQENQ